MCPTTVYVSHLSSFSILAVKVTHNVEMPNSPASYVSWLCYVGLWRTGLRIRLMLLLNLPIANVWTRHKYHTSTGGVGGSNCSPKD